MFSENDIVGKVYEKNEVISIVFMFPSHVMVLKLYKKAKFLQFCAKFSNNLSLLKQFSYCFWKFSLRSFRK